MILGESLFHKSYKYLVVGGILAAVLVMNLPFAGGWFKNRFYSLTEPFQRGAWNVSASVSATFGGISQMSSAVAENSRLKDQITSLESQLAQLNDLKKENQSLHEVLNLGLDKQYDLKMAQVIGRDVASDTLLVDKGLSDSVQTGFPVIDANKAAVGRVVAVYKNFSRVALLTGKDSSFDVRVGDAGVDGLARGQGNFNLILDLVPKDAVIGGGMLVVTSSLGGIYPKDLVVGSIVNVQKNDAQMFQKADITPAFKIESSDSVFVVMGTNSPQDQAPSKPSVTK